MSKLDKMIIELCPDGVEYKAISELFNTRNGYTPSKAKKEYWINGTIPWFRMEDIRENGRILSNATQYVSESAVKGTLFPANSIIVACGYSRCSGGAEIEKAEKFFRNRNP